MSWLGKVLGSKSAEQWLEQAELYEKAGELGDAKLAFDRAMERAKGDERLAQRADEGATRCCDGLARGRAAHARELWEAGNETLAREELQSALDTVRSKAAQRDVRAVMHELEGRDAVEAAAPVASIGAEERFALIASSWEPLQAEELETYGEPLQRALVDLDEGRVDGALEAIEALHEGAKDPRYLWLELGRVRLAAEQPEAAEQALRTFITRIGPDEGGSARLIAHSEIARMAHERGDLDAAITELEACAEALEDDPRPYLQLGNYLRLCERAAEAVEVLEMCAQLFPQGQTEWPVLMELGLAHAEADQPDQAIAVLEQVVEMLAARGHLDFPPVLAVTLAKLHEERDNLTRAADLFRGLTEGSHVDGHAFYHSETARLLDALGMHEEATRMRQRAEALQASAPETQTPADDASAPEGDPDNSQPSTVDTR